MTHHTVCSVAETSQIGEARRCGLRLVADLDLNESQLGSIAVIITELATNLALYAKSGRLLMRASKTNGFEIVSVDCGPGMDLSRCLEDGFSSGGTAGQGLGAVRRMSTEFDAYSCAATGSVIYSRLASDTIGDPVLKASLQVGAISVACPGEVECGDAWSVDITNNDLRVLVADGLGHGPEASRAAQVAIAVFEKLVLETPKQVLERSHAAMSGTRGAALSVGKMAAGTDQFCYVGVGNIGATLLSHLENRGLMSHNGTVGVRVRTVQEITYNWPDGWILIMYSDGLISRWDLTPYPGVLRCHSAIIAAVLFRDFFRGKDDITVVVVRRI